MTNLYHIWYKNGIKVLPASRWLGRAEAPDIDILFYSINPIVLAYWIMDDGTFRGYGITIYTNSFTIFEVNTLISILRYKYNIECNLHLGKNKQPNIYITSKGLKVLIPLILPYIIPDMRYKLGL